MDPQPHRPADRNGFEIAIICALTLEADAVEALFDSYWDDEGVPFDKAAGDSNAYSTGAIGRHIVVLAYMPGMGKVNAATVANNCRISFPNIRLGLVVGIAGVVPFGPDGEEITLGDVIISDGIIQYDFGRQLHDGFIRKDTLLDCFGRPNTEIRALLAKSKSLRGRRALFGNLTEHLQALLFDPQLAAKYPDTDQDILFDPTYRHVGDKESYDRSSCNGKTISRQRLQTNHDVSPAIHFGLVACGDMVMKSGQDRDLVAVREQVIAFEMESAGVWDVLPCVVIKGACDYADSHKNKKWQRYAAATAAACTKAFLRSWIPSSINQGTLQPDYTHRQASVDVQLSQDCLKSLAFEGMDDRINDVNLTAANGTCMWLLEHDVCANWSAQDRALLWIKGKPGSGKSTLLRYFLSAIKRFQPNALVLSFFFHGRGVELQKTPLGLFRSLLHQLLSEKPDARSDLVATFRHKCQFVGEAGAGWQWHLRELQEAFRTALSKALERQSVWVFIDALDECGKQSAIDLVKHFKSLLRDVLGQSSQFLIAFTCRHYPILNLDSTYEITLEDENTGDISAFVQGQLLVLYSSAESDIPTLITTYARGVFMWASLLLDKILQLDREGYGLTKIEAEIRSTPPDLNSMYLGLVRDMSERPTSLKLFQWICFATRPLSLDELRWALITDTNHESPIKSLKQVQGLQDYIHDGEKMERRLKTISCGLVEAVPSSNSRVVQFIHQSVRDFFVKEGLAALNDSLDASKSDANSTIGMAHYQISRTCIRYIAMEEIAVSAPQREVLISQFPLLHYTVSSWISHAKESESKGIPQDDLLTYFDWPSAVLLQVWLRSFGKICHFSEGLRLEMTDMQHILSQHHLISPLRVILHRANQMNININARDSTGRTPLMWAALNGDKDVIAMLLNQKDVQVHVADDSGWPALMHAGVDGHKDVVKLLLATNKAKVENQGKAGLKGGPQVAKRGGTTKSGPKGRPQVVKMGLVSGWTRWRTASRQKGQSQKSGVDPTADPKSPKSRCRFEGRLQVAGDHHHKHSGTTCSRVRRFAVVFETHSHL